MAKCIEVIDKKLHERLRQWSNRGIIEEEKPGIVYGVELHNIENPAIFSGKYQFWVGDELYSLKDIISERKHGRQKQELLSLVAKKEVLQAYIKNVQHACKKGHFSAKIMSSTGMDAGPGIPIDENIVLRVKESLPMQPWPKGVHKVVAERMGCKPRTVSAAIQELIRRGVFKQQIDGELFESK